MTFFPRLSRAMRWAGIDDEGLLAQCRRYRDEATRLLAGDLDPHVGYGAAAAYEIAEALDVSPTWLVDGRSSAAALRLLDQLTLIDMGRRSATGDVVFSSDDFAQLKALAASLPGRSTTPVIDTPEARAESQAHNGVGPAERKGRHQERVSAAAENRAP